MMVGMNGARFPEGAFERLLGQRLQTSPLFLLEDLPGAPFRRPMNLPTPISSRHHFIARSLASSMSLNFRRQPRDVANDRYVSFHLPLMPGHSHFGRIRHKALVALQFPVSPIEDSPHEGLTIFPDQPLGFYYDHQLFRTDY